VRAGDELHAQWLLTAIVERRVEDVHHCASGFGNVPDRVQQDELLEVLGVAADLEANDANPASSVRIEPPLRGFRTSGPTTPAGTLPRADREKDPCLKSRPEPGPIDSNSRRWHRRRRGSREDVDVDAAAVPFKLRERLGSEATGGFLHVLDLAQRDWREDVLSLAVERFERRLAEENAALRVQIAQSEAAVRNEIGQVEGRLRHEMDQAEGRLRQEMGQAEGRLHQEMGQVEGRLLHEVGQLEVRLRGELGHVDGELRQDLSQMELRIIREIGNSRFDLLKWTFAFWIGQVVAMSAIMAAMLRIVR
jgi:hypothetical protein